jgi:hemerythrin-like domain-containing protein
MKRHEALAPLSREHHEALILSQLLKKDAPIYKGLPTDDKGKVDYAIGLFTTKLKHHFAVEEKILAVAKFYHDSIAELTIKIKEDHETLTIMFQDLATSKQQTIDMDLLGNFLQEHIRKEERVLFPLIQEHCDEDTLQQLKELL